MAACRWPPLTAYHWPATTCRLRLSADWQPRNPLCGTPREPPDRPPLRNPVFPTADNHGRQAGGKEAGAVHCKKGGAKGGLAASGTRHVGGGQRGGRQVVAGGGATNRRRSEVVADNTT